MTSSVWNFCRKGADIPPDKTPLGARSWERQLFLQAAPIPAQAKYPLLN